MKNRLKENLTFVYTLKVYDIKRYSFGKYEKTAKEENKLIGGTMPQHTLIYGITERWTDKNSYKVSLDWISLYHIAVLTIKFSSFPFRIINGQIIRRQNLYCHEEGSL